MAPTAERLRAAGIGSDRDISTLADLARMPFSFKSDLRDQSPDGLFAVPMEQIVRIHASSGTRGKPTVVGYTRADLGIWSEVMARCLTMAGVRPGTVVHNACGYSLFTGGLGIHQGAELIGPGGVGKTRLALQVAADADRPVVGVLQAGQNAQQGGLPTAVRAEHAHQLARARPGSGFQRPFRPLAAFSVRYGAVIATAMATARVIPLSQALSAI